MTYGRPGNTQIGNEGMYRPHEPYLGTIREIDDISKKQTNASFLKADFSLTNTESWFFY